MDDLRKFLDRRARALETSIRAPQSKRDPLRQDSENSTGKAEDNPSQSYQSSSPSCPFCKQSHRIHSCPKFLALSVTEKYEKINQLRLCFNCLEEGRGIKNCSSKTTCQKREKTSFLAAERGGLSRHI